MLFLVLGDADRWRPTTSSIWGGGSLCSTKRQVKRIKPSNISTFQTKLGEKFGPSTVSGARLVVVGVLDLAVADDLIRKNPALSPAVQKVASGDNGGTVVSWSGDRVFAVIDAHPPSLRAMPMVGATLGLREGEWSAVH